MILFYDDFQRYPSVTIHYTTKNRSFVTLAELYKRMGIKNYFFHLALLNPELEKVDPHSPDLSAEEMEMIGLECKWNPWYFFREILRIPPQASPNPLPFRANRGNIALYWCFFNHIDIILIQPRQTGKSVSTDGLMVFLVRIGSRNSTIILLTKDDTLRKKNVERLKSIIDYLPPYLVLTGSEKDADNKEEITCKVLGNHYTTAISQNNINSSNNMGRGLTAPIMHIDEGPFINHMNLVVPAMLTAGNAAREEASNVGAPFGNIFTTTAGKKDTTSGAYMFDLLSGGMVLNEKVLFDAKNSREAKLIVERNSPGFKPIINATFSHRQLGYSDEWMVKSLKDNNAFGEEADRDFFNRWTSGSLSSPLPTSIMEVIKNGERDPMYCEITKDGYVVNWYIERESIGDYMAHYSTVMGLDTSDAIGKDAITFTIVNVETLATVATCVCNETNLIRFGNFVADMLIKYLKITLIPERKSSGTMMIDGLILRLINERIDPFKRIYSKIVDNYTEFETEYKEIQMDVNRRSVTFYDKFKRLMGFNTAGAGQHSRNSLYSDTLQTAARRCCNKIYDKRLSSEILGLETKNGRIDHSTGGHDDTVISWLLCIWMLTMSRNLKYYGIERALLNAPEYDQKKVNVDPYQEIKDREQESIRNEITKLFDRLKETRDDIQTMILENKIRTLNIRLTDDFSPEDSIDNLIKDAKQKKQSAARLNQKQPLDIRRNPFNYY